MTIFVPFNYEPVSMSEGTSSYTVPANKYAYVTVFLDVGAFTSFYSDDDTALVASTTQVFGMTNGADTHSFSLWLDEGEALTTSNAGSDVLTTTPALSTTFDRIFTAKQNFTVSAILNGTTICQVRASGSASARIASNSSGSVSEFAYLEVEGTANFRYQASEYNKIS